MSKWSPSEQQLGGVYAAFWRLMDMTVHRYGSHPTGQLYIVLTIMMLDRVDYYPTVGELAEIVRLPKSTVSRYVSTEMQAGFIEERIDAVLRHKREIFESVLGDGDVEDAARTARFECALAFVSSAEAPRGAARRAKRSVKQVFVETMA